MLIVLRCAPDLARRLGAIPAKMEGHIARVPMGTIVIDVGEEMPWHWQADVSLVELCDPRT